MFVVFINIFFSLPQVHIKYAIFRIWLVFLFFSSLFSLWTYCYVDWGSFIITMLPKVCWPSLIRNAKIKREKNISQKEHTVKARKNMQQMDNKRFCDEQILLEKQFTKNENVPWNNSNERWSQLFYAW